jgi:hypothetical protein
VYDETSLDNILDLMMSMMELKAANDYAANIGRRRLRTMIKDRGPITKRDIYRELNWGNGIAWTPYRSALRKCPNVIVTEKDFRWTN